MGDVKVAEARGYAAAHAQILKACKKAFENPTNRDRNVLAAWGVLNHKELAKMGVSIRKSFNVTTKLPDVMYAWHPIIRFA